MPMITMSAGQKSAFIVEELIPLLNEHLKNPDEVENILLEYVNYIINQDSYEAEENTTR